MKRIVLVLSFALLLAASNRWVGQAQQPPPADDPRFTGKSVAMDAKDLTILRRSFEAGARSAWHSHDRGQLLFVEEGRLRTEKRGQALKDMGKGDSDYTGPNVVHWHGAVPEQPVVQLNVSFGGDTKWMEKVTDEEYRGRK